MLPARAATPPRTETDTRAPSNPAKGRARAPAARPRTPQRRARPMRARARARGGVRARGPLPETPGPLLCADWLYEYQKKCVPMRARAALEKPPPRRLRGPPLRARLARPGRPGPPCGCLAPVAPRAARRGVRPCVSPWQCLGGAAGDSAVARAAAFVRVCMLLRERLQDRLRPFAVALAVAPSRPGAECPLQPRRGARARCAGALCMETPIRVAALEGLLTRPRGRHPPTNPGPPIHGVALPPRPSGGAPPPRGARRARAPPSGPPGAEATSPKRTTPQPRRRRPRRRARAAARDPPPRPASLLCRPRARGARGRRRPGAGARGLRCLICSFDMQPG